MPRHTPGPWTVLEIRPNVLHLKPGTNAMERSLAPTICAIAKTRFNKNADADARLIAAAPEMRSFFEHLDSLVAERDEDGVVSLKEPHSWETVARIALDLAHAALKLTEVR